MELFFSLAEERLELIKYNSKAKFYFYSVDD